jgi:ferredoxin
LCQHCKNAPCEKAAPDAVERRQDGVVLLDASKAKGNKELLGACPYGNISWNEERQTAQKCTMCAHLLDIGWKEPRCVQACPLRALSIVNCGDDEFEKMAKEMQLEPLTDGTNEPRVMYRNLYKRDTCFAAGALAIIDGGAEKAATEASVQLMKNGEVVAKEKADFFGEFKIDRIPKNSGKYQLNCSTDGYKPIAREINIGEDCPCLDVMAFEKT